MLKNYIKIAIRNLVQNKSYTFINILGLAVAMACCILISLYAKEELSFDKFHNKADRIIAVGTESSFFGRMLSTPYPLVGSRCTRRWPIRWRACEVNRNIFSPHITAHKLLIDIKRSR